MFKIIHAAGARVAEWRRTDPCSWPPSMQISNIDTSSPQAFWDGALTELGSVLTSTAGDVRIDGGSYAGTMKDPSAGPVVSEGADNEHGDRVADSRNNDRAMVDAGRTIDAGPGPDVSDNAIGGPFEFDSDDDVEDVDNQDATHKESGTTEDPGTAIHAGKGPIISKDDDCEGGEEDADQDASSEDACTVGGNGSTIDVDADRAVSEDKDCGIAADPGHGKGVHLASLWGIMSCLIRAVVSMHPAFPALHEPVHAMCVLHSPQPIMLPCLFIMMAQYEDTPGG